MKTYLHMVIVTQDNAIYGVAWMSAAHSPRLSSADYNNSITSCLNRERILRIVKNSIITRNPRQIIVRFRNKSRGSLNFILKLFYIPLAYAYKLAVDYVTVIEAAKSGLMRGWRMPSGTAYHRVYVCCGRMYEIIHEIDMVDMIAKITEKLYKLHRTFNNQ